MVLITVASAALAAIFGGLRGLSFPVLLVEVLPGDGSPYLLLLDSDAPSVSSLDSPFLFTYIYQNQAAIRSMYISANLVILSDPSSALTPL